ncbi:hypothetical protein I4U23_003841 [Adineta vaga]|nr:hypothetical protein I4U23_003841 [Adineta vaga]
MRRTKQLSSSDNANRKESIYRVLHEETMENMINHLDKYLLDDVMSLIWSKRTKFHRSETNDDHNKMNILFFYHWIQVYLRTPDEVLSMHLSKIPKYGDWSDLKSIYIYADRMKDTFPSEIILLEKLKLACVKMIGDQLKHDYEIVLKQLKKDSDGKIESRKTENQNWISLCVYETPQISNNPKEITTIMAKEIAEYLQSLFIEKTQAYQNYRTIIMTIRRQLKTTGLIFLEEQVAWKDRPLFCTRQQREEFLAATPSSNVIHPQPQPIVPCLLEELQPLLEYLTANKPGPSDDKQSIVFPRGTIMSGGRLDMCKQAVGPQGVQPLLNAMKHSSTVTRLLLGNNIVGRPGAEAISEYIRFNPNSTVDTWYIACNRFDSDSISLICDALATDTKVKSLWLKRNPILPSGVVHIARMLTSNTYLQTLDLLNTGLLDQGCEILFNALKLNHTLKHLYIDGNGIKSGQTIRLYFEQNYNHLETLYMSCNNLGDVGSCEIAAGLKYDQCLRRLSLASNSVGFNGARALADVLIHHPTLQQLDLGFLKSTTLLGGLDNILKDDGAAEISRLIQFNHQIRSIDLTRNGISQQGVIQLRDALKTNHTLTSLKGISFKQIHDTTIKKEINSMLTANLIEWGKQVLTADADNTSQLTTNDYLTKGKELDNAVNYPEHITEVTSYYRIQ